jgi:hypothetical protein
MLRLLPFCAGGLGWMLTSTVMGHWIPLAWLSFALDYSLGGLEPRVYHATNLALHALNAALVCVVARLLLRPVLCPRGGEAAVGAGALGAALLFAVHPLRAETVAWISDRRDPVRDLRPRVGLGLPAWRGRPRPCRRGMAARLAGRVRRGAGLQGLRAHPAGDPTRPRPVPAAAEPSGLADTRMGEGALRGARRRGGPAHRGGGALLGGGSRLCRVRARRASRPCRILLLDPPRALRLARRPLAPLRIARPGVPSRPALPVSNPRRPRRHRDAGATPSSMAGRARGLGHLADPAGSGERHRARGATRGCRSLHLPLGPRSDLPGRRRDGVGPRRSPPGRAPRRRRSRPRAADLAGGGRLAADGGLARLGEPLAPRAHRAAGLRRLP